MLGPLLFTLYAIPLSVILSILDIKHQLHADDTRIYISLSVLIPSRKSFRVWSCSRYSRLYICVWFFFSCKDGYTEVDDDVYVCKADDDGSDDTVAIAVGVSVAVVVIIAVIIAFVCYKRKQRENSKDDV